MSTRFKIQKKKMLVLHTRPCKVDFCSTEGQALYWSMMTASNVSAQTRAWQAKVDGFKVQGFFCKCFLPFFLIPPRYLTCAIFRAVFDDRSLFFAPIPHRNACYAGYRILHHHDLLPPLYSSSSSSSSGSFSSSFFPCFLFFFFSYIFKIYLVLFFSNPHRQSIVTKVRARSFKAW